MTDLIELLQADGFELDGAKAITAEAVRVLPLQAGDVLVLQFPKDWGRGDAARVYAEEIYHYIQRIVPNVGVLALQNGVEVIAILRPGAEGLGVPDYQDERQPKQET